ncbi:MAG: ATP-binding cassette domain-containing protein, partial [Casimicrobiaceae bacterium]
MIHLDHVCRTFAGPRPRNVLDHVSLDVAPGALVAILGESGVGKSTLLNLIAGLDRPDAGTLVVAGRDLVALDDDALTLFRRRHVGFVFQAFHVLPYLSVAQNVALPLALLEVDSAEADARVASMLDAVGLGDRAFSMPRELSGGEMQRTAIARALVHRPQV